MWNLLLPWGTPVVARSIDRVSSTPYTPPETTVRRSESTTTPPPTVTDTPREEPRDVTPRDRVSTTTESRTLTPLDQRTAENLLVRVQSGSDLTDHDVEALNQLFDKLSHAMGEHADQSFLNGLKAKLTEGGTLSTDDRQRLDDMVGRALDGATDPLAHDTDGLPNGLERAISRELERALNDRPMDRQLLAQAMDKLDKGKPLSEIEKTKVGELIGQALEQLPGNEEQKAAIRERLERALSEPTDRGEVMRSISHILEGALDPRTNPLARDRDGLPDGLERAVSRELERALNSASEQDRGVMERALEKLKAGGTGENKLTEEEQGKLRELLGKAAEGLKERGATPEQVERLKAWVQEGIPEGGQPGRNVRESLQNILTEALAEHDPNPLARDSDGLPDGLEGALRKQLSQALDAKPVQRNVLESIQGKLRVGDGELTPVEKQSLKDMLAGALAGLPEERATAIRQAIDNLGSASPDTLATLKSVIDGALDPETDPLANDLDGLPDGLEKMVARELEKAIGTAKPEDVQFLKDLRAKIASGETPDESEVERLRTLVTDSPGPGLESVTPFDNERFDKAVERVSKSQQGGEGDYEVFGPIPPGRVQALQEREYPPGVHAVIQTDESGQKYLILHNDLQGTPKNFHVDPGYSSEIPGHPPAVNKHPLAAIGQMLAEIAKGIAAGVNQKGASSGEGAQLVAALMNGDVSLPAEAPRKFSEGPRVEVRWQESRVQETEEEPEPEETPSRRVEAHLLGDDTASGHVRTDINKMTPEEAKALFEKYQGNDEVREKHPVLMQLLNQRGQGQTLVTSRPRTETTPEVPTVPPRVQEAINRLTTDLTSETPSKTPLKDFRETVNNLRPEDAKKLLETYGDRGGALLTMLQQRSTGATFSMAPPPKQRERPVSTNSSDVLANALRRTMEEVTARMRDTSGLEKAKSGETPPEELAQLTRSRDEEVVLAAAKNERTPPEALARLAESTDDDDVRRALLANPNTPTEAKQKIQEFFDEWA